MPDITFPRSSAPGSKAQESGGRLINAFVEKTLQGAPSDVIIRRSPGLESIPPRTGSAQSVHTRGFLDIGSECIWILDERAVKFNEVFDITQLGALPGTLPVTTARNNANPKQNVVVTEIGTFVLLPNGAPTAYPDPDLPGTATSVCDIDGYFVWSFADGRIFASNLNSTDVSALSFTTEQGLIVRRVVRYAGRLYAFGDKWTGVYKDVGSIPFPFAREVTIPRGIIGTHAIAGWETGWASQLVWVGDDFVVYRLDGYTPVPISTDDVSRAIQSAVLAGRRDTIEASVYMFGKNAFWAVTVKDRFTWEYNLITGEWNERQSYNRASWKGCKSVRVFDRWIIGDYFTGELYQISGTYFKEGLDPLIWHVESGVVAGFPMGMVIPKSSFHMTAGVGDYLGVPDPVVQISWSLNGGATYGDPVLRKLGAAGRYNSHPSILNSGLSRGQGVRYRLRVSDAVHVGLSGGVIVDPEPRSFAG